MANEIDLSAFDEPIKKELDLSAFDEPVKKKESTTPTGGEDSTPGSLPPGIAAPTTSKEEDYGFPGAKPSYKVTEKTTEYVPKNDSASGIPQGTPEQLTNALSAADLTTQDDTRALRLQETIKKIGSELQPIEQQYTKQGLLNSMLSKPELFDTNTDDIKLNRENQKRLDNWLGQIANRLPKNQASEIYDYGTKLNKHKNDLIEFTTRLNQNPDDKDAAYGLGNIELDLGNNQAALNAYTLALKGSNYSDSRAYNGLGYIFLQNGDTDSAKEYYEKAVELKPDDAIALNALGTIAAKNKDNDKAREYYNQALAIDPYNNTATYNKYKLSAQSGNKEEAKKDLERYQLAKALTTEPLSIGAPGTEEYKQAQKAKQIADMYDTFLTGGVMAEDPTTRRIFRLLNPLGAAVTTAEKGVFEGAEEVSKGAKLIADNMAGSYISPDKAKGELSGLVKVAGGLAHGFFGLSMGTTLEGALFDFGATMAPEQLGKAVMAPATTAFDIIAQGDKGELTSDVLGLIDVPASMLMMHGIMQGKAKLVDIGKKLLKKIKISPEEAEIAKEALANEEVGIQDAQVARAVTGDLPEGTTIENQGDVIADKIENATPEQIKEAEDKASKEEKALPEKAFETPAVEVKKEEVAAPGVEVKAEEIATPKPEDKAREEEIRKRGLDRLFPLEIDETTSEGKKLAAEKLKQEEEIKKLDAELAAKPKPEAKTEVEKDLEELRAELGITEEGGAKPAAEAPAMEAPKPTPAAVEVTTKKLEENNKGEKIANDQYDTETIYYRGTETPESSPTESIGHEHFTKGVSTTTSEEYAKFNGKNVKRYYGKKGKFIDYFDLLDEYRNEFGEDAADNITEEQLTDYGKKKGYIGTIMDDPMAGTDYRFFDASSLIDADNLNEGVAKAYEQAKKDGSNEELVAKVEEKTSKEKEIAPPKTEIEKIITEEELKNFYDAKDSRGNYILKGKKLGYTQSRFGGGTEKYQPIEFAYRTDTGDVEYKKFPGNKKPTLSEIKKEIKTLLDENKNITNIDLVIDVAKRAEEGAMKSPETTLTVYERKSGQAEKAPTKIEEEVVAKVKPEVKEGDTVEIPSPMTGGMPRQMVYKDGGWKQKIGRDFTEVGKSVQEEAQLTFETKAKPTVEEGLKAIDDAKESTKKFLRDNKIISDGKTKKAGFVDPEKVIDKAFDLAKGVYKASYNVNEAIKKAIDHIKTSSWYKSLSPQEKAMAEETVTKQITDFSKTTKRKLEPEQEAKLKNYVQRKIEAGKDIPHLREVLEGFGLSEGKIEEMLGGAKVEEKAPMEVSEKAPMEAPEKVEPAEIAPQKETIAKFSELTNFDQKISQAETTAKKRQIQAQKDQYLKDNQSIKAIYLNAKDIIKQLEEPEKGLITKKEGPCF